MENINNRYRDILSEIKIFEDALAEVEDADRRIGSIISNELILEAISKKFFGPISALDSKFNPQNMPNIPAVKFFVRLDLEPKLFF